MKDRKQVSSYLKLLTFKENIGKRKYQHIRRIKHYEDRSLIALVPEELELNQSIIKSNSFLCETIKVPTHAPLNKHQAQVWSKLFWPVDCINANNGIKLNPDFSVKEKAYLFTHMNDCLNLFF